jgi:hypothetical protein
VKPAIALTLLASSALAAPDPRARFAHEPTVSALQRAAAKTAEVSPERVRSWMRRVNAAALLPAVRARLGRGVAALQIRGLDAYVPATDAWRFEIEAGWQLDRLVFDRAELGVARESQRLAARREDLLTHVARLYYERRRLQIDALSDPNGEGALERALAIDELTAILDGLTGGALTHAGAP